jgi:ABC-2 type transport system ATP-binding protein
MPEPDTTALAAHGVTVTFGRLRALDDVSCRLSGTGVQGLIGVNGAGKTTLIHALIGLQPVSKGSVSLAGSIAAVGYCPDTPSFEPWLIAREVIEQSCRLGRRSAPVPSPEEVDEILDQVGLGHARDQKVGGFSRGMRQRLGIAAAIVRRPKILILDEPTSALDPVGREDVIRLMVELGRSMLVVFSSHILEDVETIAETLIVLHRGTVIYRGSMEGFLATADHQDQVAVSLSGEREAVLAHLEARGIAWEADIGDERRVLVPAGSLSRLLETLRPHTESLVAIERAQGSLQTAFIAAIDESGDRERAAAR